MLGTVNWYNSGLGYGFISRDEGGADIFVHVTEIKRAGLETLTPGQRVHFNEVMSQKTRKFCAEQIRVVSEHAHT
ncbi:MAG: cold shock domain-containing protein [Alphaproteobacteria bacterium]|nr:cold shock domain-containing protein [Alphaproteobacteria bacterium]